MPEALARAVMQDMRWSVKERHGLGSVEPLHAGVFTVVQRFHSDLGLYVHLHCLITDGAFEEAGERSQLSIWAHGILGILLT